MMALALALSALDLDSNAQLLELCVLPVSLPVSVAPSGDVSDTAQFLDAVSLASALVSDVFAFLALAADALALFALLVALVLALLACVVAVSALAVAVDADAAAFVSLVLAFVSLAFAVSNTT